MEAHMVPWLVYKFGLWLVTFLERLIDLIVPAPQTVLKKATSAITSHVIWTCCQLNLSEVIGAEQMSVSSLAEAVGVPETSLIRLLRAAKQCGIFDLKSNSEGITFIKNNAQSLVLHSGNPATLKPLIQNLQYEFKCFDHMEYALKTAEIPDQPSAFAKQYGTEMWTWLSDDPKRHLRFTEGMKVRDSLGVQALVKDYPWKKHARVLDIGGASGSFLAAILQAPGNTSRGVICDLAPVVEDARNIWGSRPELKTLQQRVSFQDIDFFQPGEMVSGSDGDCFLLRDICHDWSDSKSITILQKVRASMGSAKCTLAIVEMSYMDDKLSPLSTASSRADLVMLTNHRGKERTKAEWSALFKQSGFQLEQIIQTRSPYYVTVAKPVASA